ncbi:hypothetical protein COW98_00275 [Candidatus Roizmanbacteria bacterium CG22_combo_CG10-13_8_21_14_all_35_9]|uniref:Uncharacterized protein n=4 Tax=Candidatus Roizmaniibacteriota TaxID=1752723 RepID=A0A2M8F496_9BACT|nr:MAG: hypothetical protein COX47_02540 [Candidatus Roizmanbacteria bacterium CG23_combo_of_CG06-09_8_20_14_all_35_49]PIP63132.1 MAG: hypothetical protein COW98_00275 [Candidatus Roizmanbacteria bacterium CG22_combo_CG10-13_8_21_14_all_35_9]PIY70942.1 MAG: hypothetical protein COY88_02935 [Candidatus Roizmanbacteria bacterium CG_4_10_14_0_8_um_filter_35_28]PJC34133.1 MAG: hypothetical protein CO048_01050 [Candidatus Roizmanbacteria bacterium CG_4_9_14_0_2_um_filter_35_15]PJC82471.1 MAG: hypoth
MDKLQELEKRVEEIEKRNKRVELDKAWETSYSRRFFLVFFTYLSIAFYLKYILKVEPWLNAIVPTLGFLLSTLTLPFLKKLWDRYIYKK